jgi:hypothetical protein
MRRNWERVAVAKGAAGEGVKRGKSRSAISLLHRRRQSRRAPCGGSPSSTAERIPTLWLAVCPRVQGEGFPRAVGQRDVNRALGSEGHEPVCQVLGPGLAESGTQLLPAFLGTAQQTGRISPKTRSPSTTISHARWPGNSPRPSGRQQLWCSWCRTDRRLVIDSMEPGPAYEERTG